MKEQTTEWLIESRPSWEDLKAFARQGIQTWFQRLLEEEVEGLLGRCALYTRGGIDAPEPLAEVAEGAIYVNGERVKPSLSAAEKKAAA